MASKKKQTQPKVEVVEKVETEVLTETEDTETKTDEALETQAEDKEEDVTEDVTPVEVEKDEEQTQPKVEDKSKLDCMKTLLSNQKVNAAVKQKEIYSASVKMTVVRN